jgi:hypothetical protein
VAVGVGVVVRVALPAATVIVAVGVAVAIGIVVVLVAVGVADEATVGFGVRSGMTVLVAVWVMTAVLVGVAELMAGIVLTTVVATEVWVGVGVVEATTAATRVEVAVDVSRGTATVAVFVGGETVTIGEGVAVGPAAKAGAVVEITTIPMASASLPRRELAWVSGRGRWGKTTRLIAIKRHSTMPTDSSAT